MQKNPSKNRAGRATIVTTVTDELEELDVGIVMMSYELPQEPETMTTDEPPDPEDDPREVVFFQMIAEHSIDSDNEPGYEYNHISASNEPAKNMQDRQQKASLITRAPFIPDCATECTT